MFKIPDQEQTVQHAQFNQKVLHIILYNKITSIRKFTYNCILKALITANIIVNINLINLSIQIFAT